MKLCFDSIEEVQDFVKKLKGTRGGKKDDDEATGAGQAAPQPLAPPAGPAAGFTPGGAPGFAPPVAGATQAAVGQFAPGAPVVGPEVQALVTRINAKLDGAIASGQPEEAVVQWFRSQCGPEAAQASKDQIKTVFLPKLTVPALENIAKLMNA